MQKPTQKEYELTAKIARITECGEIRDLWNQKKETHRNNNGYQFFWLDNKMHFVHILMAIKYCSHKIKYYQVHHLDENKQNNHFENLVSIPKYIHNKIHKNIELTEKQNRTYQNRVKLIGKNIIKPVKLRHEAKKLIIKHFEQL